MKKVIIEMENGGIIDIELYEDKDFRPVINKLEDGRYELISNKSNEEILVSKKGPKASRRLQRNIQEHPRKNI